MKKMSIILESKSSAPYSFTLGSLCFKTISIGVETSLMRSSNKKSIKVSVLDKKESSKRKITISDQEG